jgi:hypothetical protein
VFLPRNPPAFQRLKCPAAMLAKTGGGTQLRSRTGQQAAIRLTYRGHAFGGAGP